MGIPPQFFNGMDIHLLAILRNIGDVNGQQRGVWYHMISPMNWRDFSRNEASIPQKSAEILVPCGWSCFSRKSQGYWTAAVYSTWRQRTNF
jgi:hypothetical protein